MKTILAVSIAPLALTAVASAQTSITNPPTTATEKTDPRTNPATTATEKADSRMMTSVPAHSMTVTHWYKQNVYDKAQATIGDVKDVLLGPDGQVSALVISVGGFLGMGEHDVAVPFTAVMQKSVNGKDYLTLNETKDSLRAAPGLKYDSTSMTWVASSK